MNIQGGQYLDQAGNRIRRWMWPNLSPGPQVQLSPIFISLNRHVGVRILAQDKIFVSFLAMGRQAKFNMGTKVQVLFLCQATPHSASGAAREAAICAYPMVDASYVAPCSFLKKQVVELYSFHSCGDGALASPSSLQGASVGLHAQATSPRVTLALPQGEEL